jgi:predicted MPP superfamily phosphohydrolase
LNRRTFTSLGLSTAAAAAATTRLWAESAKPASNGRHFYIAVIADSHIIDSDYHGQEETPEDTESLYHTATRLTAARDFINSLGPRIEQVFHLGDYFHDYPSTDYDFYFTHRTRVDIAKEITDGFHAPMHLLLGNHDYGVPGVSREFTHRLFQAKYGVAPYSALDYKEWKFLQLNCFLGDTWDIKSPRYDQGTGSLGERQLQWAEARFAEGKPTVVFVHYPLWIVAPEIGDLGLHPLLRRYREQIKLVVSGHWHKWVDFAHTFGPQHYVMAATRYDENASMLIEIDREGQTCRFLNAGLVEWSTHYSRRYGASVPL